MKNYDHRKISIHRAYTVSQIAEIFSASTRTIFNWIKNGLVPIEHERKPLLFQGETIRDHLKQSRKKWPPMKKHEFPCLKCKRPRRAKEKSISVFGNVRYAKCSVCGRKVCRFIKPP